MCIHADDKSSKLYLENPKSVLNLLRPEKYTDAIFEFAKFQLSPGDLLLFPAWIKHGSGFEPNDSKTRVVASFNGN